MRMPQSMASFPMSLPALLSFLSLAIFLEKDISIKFQFVVVVNEVEPVFIC